ncbi:DUF6415 family natural product biosynthesis protein [Streptomyces sp. NPDC050564]|uniref:DUF6415 family natural product biosynthesis protein n=1 Tax=Streptomyces sp. NPDC050564 TaxID=3365631 RepID=UPI00378BB77E
MANASSSGTAMIRASTAPCRAACSDGPAEVDADTIRQTYEAVLWTGAPGDEQEQLGDLLVGHVQLLLPEVSEYVPRMRGAQQSTALHVITRTRHLLEDGPGASPQEETSRIWNLATQCRALLTLYLHPGPLNERAVGDLDERRS